MFIDLVWLLRNRRLPIRFINWRLLIGRANISAGNKIKSSWRQRIIPALENVPCRLSGRGKTADGNSAGRMMSAADERPLQSIVGPVRVRECVGVQWIARQSKHFHRFVLVFLVRSSIDFHQRSYHLIPTRIQFHQVICIQVCRFWWSTSTRKLRKVFKTAQVSNSQEVRLMKLRKKQILKRYVTIHFNVGVQQFG